MVAAVLCSMLLLVQRAEAGDARVLAELARLGAPVSAERAAAERWLRAHVESGHFPLLAEAAAGADAEVRRRLVEVIAADGGRPDLALFFLAEASAPLQELGGEALARLALAWNARLAAPALVGAAVEERLAELRRDGRPELFALDLAAPLEESLQLLDRAGALPLGVTVDPTRPAPERAASTSAPRLASGPWDELLLRLAEAHGLRLELYGSRSKGRGVAVGANGFVVLTPATRPAPPGTDLLVRWARATLVDPSPAQRAASLTSLVAIRWPALLAWLERRWAQAKDPLVEDALLRAMSTGRIPPSWTEPAGVARLLELAVGALSAAAPEPRVRGELALQALRRLPCLGPAGDDATLVLLGGWDVADPRGLWVRLAALEGLGGAAPEAVRRVDELLAAPPSSATSAPELLRQALRARVALARSRPGGPPPTLGAPWTLLASVTDVAAAEELVALLARLQMPVPEAWRPAALAAGRPPPPALARAVPLGAWLGAGEVDVAAEHLLARLAEATPGEERAVGAGLAALLRPFALRGEEVTLLGLFQAARARAAGPAPQLAVDRVALLAGALPTERLDELLALSLEDPAWATAGGDPALLGALGGRSDAPSAALGAQETLLALLGAAAGAPGVAQAPRPTALLAALERTLDDLFAQARDGEALLFLERIRRRLTDPSATQGPDGDRRPGTRARRPPVGWPAEVLAEGWPPPPRLRLVPLSQAERRLPYGRL